MTNWRTQKLALISALWMLFAFVMPMAMASPVCAAMSASWSSVESLSVQAHQSNETPDAKPACCKFPSSHDKAATCSTRAAAQASSCCCAHNSAPSLQKAFVPSIAQRVLDTGADTCYTVSVVPHTSLKNLRITWSIAHEARKSSLDKPPISGRAPPVHWL